MAPALAVFLILPLLLHSHLFAALGEAGAPCGESAKKHITPLLSSSSHSVRYHAAITLSALATVVPKLLGELLPFVSDTL
jgi:hypothetical protein